MIRVVLQLSLHAELAAPRALDGSPSTNRALKMITLTKPIERRAEEQIVPWRVLRGKAMIIITLY